MKVMLGEIERKKAEVEEARAEEERRARERAGTTFPAEAPPGTAGSIKDIPPGMLK
ncbi:MAG TPA: hypothetical protein VHY75_12660 [Steroidobacteraceae bacterium]|nr:hypothetical protein [Steroidobacteraceae bacterium]